MTRVDWVANLRANPEAVLWIKRRPVRVIGQELSGHEYDAARSRALQRWPNAVKYERSGRPIPFFRLEQLAPRGAS